MMEAYGQTWPLWKQYIVKELDQIVRMAADGGVSQIGIRMRLGLSHRAANHRLEILRRAGYLEEASRGWWKVTCC